MSQGNNTLRNHGLRIEIGGIESWSERNGDIGGVNKSDEGGGVATLHCGSHFGGERRDVNEWTWRHTVAEHVGQVMGGRVVGVFELSAACRTVVSDREHPGGQEICGVGMVLPRVAVCCVDDGRQPGRITGRAVRCAS